MSKSSGHSQPISLAQRAVCDFLAASQAIPTVQVGKNMHLGDLVAARHLAQPRPSWCAIFTKAYAKVVAARPDLRRVHLSFPWERLFEYAEATADIVIESRLNDEDVLVGLLLKRPAQCPLLDIDLHLQEHKKNPLECSKRFRSSLRIARLPRFLRRFAWWYALNVSGRLRGKYFGTFGVSSVSNWGVDALRLIAPWTTTLHYGVIDKNGDVTVRLTTDHRVLNGSGPSKALNEMEHFLNTDLLAEVRGLHDGMRTAA